MSYCIRVIKDLLCLLYQVLKNNATNNTTIHFYGEIVCKMAESVLNHLQCFFIDHKSYREDIKI